MFINVPLVEHHVFTIHLYFVVSHLLNVKEHGCVPKMRAVFYKNKEHLSTLFCFILNIWHWRQQ